MPRVLSPWGYVVDLFIIGGTLWPHRCDGLKVTLGKARCKGCEQYVLAIVSVRYPLWKTYLVVFGLVPVRQQRSRVPLRSS